MYDVGAWLAGPAIKDKLWFAGTWHDQRLDSYKLGSYNPDGTQVIDDNIMWTATAKVAWQMTRSAQLSYFHNLQYKLIGHRGGGTFADSRARNYNDKYPTVNQVKYTSPIGTKMVFDVTYSRFRADDAFGSRPEVKPGDIATNDTTTQTTEVALPTYDANDMHRDQVRTSMSFFKGTHDVKVGYEYVNGARISRIWSTSGLRANFANGVPTSVNTYLVQVTQFRHDLRRRHRRAVPVPCRRARLLHPGSLDADAQARAESRPALRDELELPAGDLPADDAVRSRARASTRSRRRPSGTCRRDSTSCTT